MENVSQVWKDEHRKLLVGESFVEVTLNIGDPESQADSTPSDNGANYLSNSSKLTDSTDRTPTRYETLENNLWRLDGTFKMLPDEATENNEGFISSVMCDENGVFTDLVPIITIVFGKVYTKVIPGISIVWSNAYEEYAKRFRITAYSGTEVTFQGEFENDGDITSVASADLSNYDKIEIEVLEWCLPNRRARIESILIGITKTYEKADILNYSHSNFVDPLSTELPKNQIVFEVKNLNGEYNPDNPKGAEKYLMERQSITARYGYKLNGEIEWISAGTFFMSEWDTPQNGITSTFTARDSLEYMTDVYEGTVSGTLLEIATAAFTQADLPVMDDGSVRWYVDESLSSISAPSNVELDEETTIAEVLQYVANAGCCVFFQDREGRIRIEPINTDVTDYLIDKLVSYENSEISLNKQLKAVNVNNGQYVLSVGSVGETQLITNPFISDEQAPVVAQWIADYLVNRQVLTGEFRADPRLDALDRITNINQFAEKTVLVTEIVYSYGGAFRGSYTGRAGV